MRRTRRSARYDDTSRDQATEWLIRFCDDDVHGADLEEFEAWLRAAPQHVHAYLQISALWEAAEGMRRPREAELAAIVDRAAQRALLEGNVVSLGSKQGPTPPHAGRRLTRAPRRVLLVASLVLICLAGSTVLWQASRYPTYATQIGEQRTLTLPDGSTVALNSRSRIKVRFGHEQRSVDLLEGQALFHVAKDPARPFIVMSAGTSIRALGTQFDVYLKPEGTVVTVLEGRVAVSDPRSGPALESDMAGTPNAPPPAAVLLVSGEQVTVSPHAAMAAKRANPTVATAWTSGKLVFDETPLEEVVREFNRYNPRPLVIEDVHLLSFHISGTFEATNSEQMVRFLSRRFALVVHESGDEIRLSREQH
jgi:transmembrane sensor